MFLRPKNEAAFHLLRSKDVLEILPIGFEDILIYQLYAKAKEMGTGKCVKAETNRRDERAYDYFHRFANKGERSFTDLRSRLIVVHECHCYLVHDCVAPSHYIVIEKQMN